MHGRATCHSNYTDMHASRGNRRVRGRKASIPSDASGKNTVYFTVHAALTTKLDFKKLSGVPHALFKETHNICVAPIHDICAVQCPFWWLSSELRSGTEGERVTTHPTGKVDLARESQRYMPCHKHYVNATSSLQTEHITRTVQGAIAFAA